MSRLLALVPTPWLVVALLAVLGAVYGAGEYRGRAAGSQAVQARWDRDAAEQARRAAENAQRARDTERTLQARQDAERKKNAQDRQAISRRLDLALGELRDRPGRPADLVPGGAGDRQGATGAGLFAEDAAAALREAARADQQRDALAACYRAYDAVRDALTSLSQSR